MASIDLLFFHGRGHWCNDGVFDYFCPFFSFIDCIKRSGFFGFLFKLCTKDNYNFGKACVSGCPKGSLVTCLSFGIFSVDIPIETLILFILDLL
ncbi:unnamed protein product [Prunus armeniaca]|uniref:Uncharacterized protein n=1 Tax=Prunus armeniaca TaxID=36596 RepID=A0A6J5WQX7_PRUAR|nr:unnamed protein product [Prunus armeniaca]CAB4300708.1 unnamed protein product [Prunus armeniaca]